MKKYSRSRTEQNFSRVKGKYDNDVDCLFAFLSFFNILEEFVAIAKIGTISNAWGSNDFIFYRAIDINELKKKFRIRPWYLPVLFQLLAIF